VICPKLDVYALGVIAFEMVYRFGTRAERNVVLEALGRGVLPDGFGDGESESESEMARGVLHMVCKKREERWGVAEVRAWLAGMGG